MKLNPFKAKDPLDELEDYTEVNELDDVIILGECEEKDVALTEEELNIPDPLTATGSDSDVAQLHRSAKAPVYGVNGTLGPAVLFTWKETSCHDGTPLPKAKRVNAVRAAHNLNALRMKVAAHYGVNVSRVKVAINSWYRTPRYNKKIGGVGFSQHIVGDATDVNFYVRRSNGSLGRVPGARVRALAERVPGYAKGGVGAYSTFTHLDVRGYRARWTGP